MSVGERAASCGDYWRWGDDNLFPQALSLLARRSSTHRRIINDKADYISGKGFSSSIEDERITRFINRANASGESLRQVLNKLSFDKALFGNAFLEIVTNQSRSTLALYHHDASRCRLARDGGHILLHHDWSQYRTSEAISLPKYPNFEQSEDGMLRAMIHYKDYEPTFEHYGVPPYIAGMAVAAVAYKTDEWNISRLDNSFQMSGVMLLDNSVDSEEEANEVIRAAQDKFGGKPGQVLFVLREGSADDNSRFIPLSSENDGDWQALHASANADIVVAHSWFRALSGLDYSTGFSSERIINEYEVALGTIILGEQAELMEPIRSLLSSILEVDCSSLEIVNRPPTQIKPSYMKVWEARRADGLDFDQEDAAQQRLLSEI